MQAAILAARPTRGTRRRKLSVCELVRDGLSEDLIVTPGVDLRCPSADRIEKIVPIGGSQASLPFSDEQNIGDFDGPMRRHDDFARLSQPENSQHLRRP